MIKLNKLTLRNFMSYGNNTTNIKLQFDKPTLIVGKNFDASVDGQVDSNGAGKSTILNAIAFCLYGNTVANVAGADNLINYTNAKNMETSVEFEKNGVHYKVQRYRKNKPLGGDGVRLLINEKEPVFHVEHDKTPDSVANTNAKIVEILGIPFEIFSRIVIFSATYEPFLSLPGSHASKPNQRDIIEELFGLTELTRKADKLKELIKTTNSDIKDVTQSNERIVAERGRYEAQLTTTKVKLNAWDEHRDLVVDAAKLLLERYNLLDFNALLALIKDRDDAKSAITILEAELKSANSTLQNIINNNKQKPAWDISHAAELEGIKRELNVISQIDVKALTEIADNIRELTALKSLKQTSLHAVNDKITTTKRKHTKLTDELATLSDAKCPYCKQDFHDVMSKMEETTSEILTLQGSLDTDEAEKAVLVGELTDITTELDELKKTTIPPNLKDITTSIQKLEVKYATLSEVTNPFTITSTDVVELDVANLTVDIEDAQAIMDSASKKIQEQFPIYEGVGAWSTATVQKVQSDIGNLSLQISTKTAEVNPFIDIVNEIEVTLRDTIPQPNNTRFDELHDTLEHQNFLLKLLTKKDSFVRKALLNKNIPFLNSRLAHYLSAIGLKHNVLFTEEMGANIRHFGTDYHYGNLSAGQAARVNIALSFAFRDVLQARFDKISFCILDECLDVGLGNVGIQLAAKMIKSIATTDKLSMLVISHRDEIASMFDSTLEVELRNGFSNVLSGAFSDTIESED